MIGHRGDVRPRSRSSRPTLQGPGSRQMAESSEKGVEHVGRAGEAPTGASDATG